MIDSNSCLQTIADNNDLLCLKKENSSDAIPHNNLKNENLTKKNQHDVTIVTTPQHDLLPNNNTSTTWPLEKPENQKKLATLLCTTMSIGIILLNTHLLE